MKRTRWISGKYKPAQPGIYERTTYPGSVIYSLWTGNQWMVCAFNMRAALKSKDVSSRQDWKWRGLAENPLAS